MKIIFKNLWSIQSFYFGKDAGTILVLGMLFLVLKKRNEAKIIFSENIIPILIAVSCTLPYIFVLVTDRYIWINNIVLGVLAIAVFDVLSKKNRNISIVFLLIFSILIAFQPAKELLANHDDYSNIFLEEETLSKYISGNTVSVLTNGEIGGENYTKSTLINYFSHSKYFGILCVPEQSKNMSDELKKYKIKYLLSWNNLYSMPDSLYQDAVMFPKSGVKVYKLK
jgi:hypothetical protein